MLIHYTGAYKASEACQDIGSVPGRSATVPACAEWKQRGTVGTASTALFGAPRERGAAEAEANARTHKHTRTNERMRILVQVQGVHACVHTHRCMRACMRTRVDGWRHARTHTRMHAESGRVNLSATCIAGSAALGGSLGRSIVVGPHTTST